VNRKAIAEIRDQHMTAERQIERRGGQLFGIEHFTAGGSLTGELDPVP